MPTGPGTQGPSGSTMTPFPQGFPNGPALSLPGGTPSFGQSDVMFSRPFSTGSFPPTFAGGPQSSAFFGRQGQMFDPRFGFSGQPPVNPGPEFTTTGSGQASTDFNIAFQPLPPNQPTQPQNIPSNQFTSTSGATMTSGVDVVTGNTGFETTFTQGGQNNAAVTNTIVERNVNEGNIGLENVGQGGMGVSTSTSQTGSEFRVVEVGNILDNSGFVTGRDIPTPSSTGNVDFQPAGDINSAFQTLTRKRFIVSLFRFAVSITQSLWNVGLFFLNVASVEKNRLYVRWLFVIPSNSTC